MVEFVNNNNRSASTKLCPFFAIEGLHPYISFDIVELSDANTYKWILKYKTLDIFRNIEPT